MSSSRATHGEEFVVEVAVVVVAAAVAAVPSVLLLTSSLVSERTRFTSSQLPEVTTSRSLDRNERGYSSSHCHTFPANARDTGFRSLRN
jgi:hypothetical protein